MKKIQLVQLSLTNFKGTRSLVINPTMNTEIVGKNKAGKSTIADAYMWLLYGKNQFDQTDFSIKTLDQNNNSIPKLNHEVEGVFNVDGENITFKRVYREKWVIKRGQEIEELTGHETTFFVNDVPVSLSEYKVKVSNLIDEKISKIISNPLYFNTQLKWQDRREILSQMAGEISNDEILSTVNLPEIVSLLSQGKDLEDQKKIIGAQKKRIKDELEMIPSRIDESNRSKPDAQNWTELEKQIESNKIEIQKTTDEIDNANKSIQSQRESITANSNRKLELQNKFNALNNQLVQEVNAQFQEVQNTIQIKNRKIESIKIENVNLASDSDKLQKAILTIQENNKILKSQYEQWSAKQFTFDPNSTCCPACKRQMDNAKNQEEQLKTNFNTQKLNSINSIKNSAKENNLEIEEKQKRVQEIHDTIEVNKKLITDIESEIEALKLVKEPSIIIEPTDEMKAIQSEFESIVIDEIQMIDVSVQRSKINELNEANQTLISQLQNKVQIERIEARLKELNEQQRTLSQELAGFEKIEFQISQFDKAKNDLVESRVNGKFALVKFKMFETQINGGESPACICTVNGVPFNDVNTADKINAGIDIINALQYHFGIFAPVFIDQRESVSVLHKTDCQMISLKVDETKEKLTIITD